MLATFLNGLLFNEKMYNNFRNMKLWTKLVESGEADQGVADT